MKGGSIASDSVVSLVDKAGFDRLNGLFTNEITSKPLSGGGCGCNRGSHSKYCSMGGKKTRPSKSVASKASKDSKDSKANKDKKVRFSRTNKGGAAIPNIFGMLRSPTHESFSNNMQNVTDYFYEPPQNPPVLPLAPNTTIRKPSSNTRNTYFSVNAGTNASQQQPNSRALNSSNSKRYGNVNTGNTSFSNSRNSGNSGKTANVTSMNASTIDSNTWKRMNATTEKFSNAMMNNASLYDVQEMELIESNASSGGARRKQTKPVKYHDKKNKAKYLPKKQQKGGVDIPVYPAQIPNATPIQGGNMNPMTMSELMEAPAMFNLRHKARRNMMGGNDKQQIVEIGPRIDIASLPKMQLIRPETSADSFIANEGVSGPSLMTKNISFGKVTDNILDPFSFGQLSKLAPAAVPTTGSAIAQAGGARRASKSASKSASKKPSSKAANKSSRKLGSK